MKTFVLAGTIGAACILVAAVSEIHAQTKSPQAPGGTAITGAGPALQFPQAGPHLSPANTLFRQTPQTNFGTVTREGIQTTGKNIPEGAAKWTGPTLTTKTGIAHCRRDNCGNQGHEVEHRQP